jgi:hypothetical protein
MFMRLVLGFTVLFGIAGCGVVAGPTAQSSAAGAHGGTSTSPRRVAFAAGVGGADCAQHVQLNGNPGTIVAKAKITSVFWGGYWAASGSSERTGYDQTWRDVGNSGAFYARLAEYSTPTQTLQAGSWSGSVLANSGLASGALITEDAIQAELSAEIGAGIVPSLTANSVYVIMLPPGVTSQYDQQNNFAGHHRQFVDPQRGSQAIRYAVIVYGSDAQYVNPVISHEISETITDPDLSTGWLDPSDGEEVGDICRFNYFTLDGFQIEKIFSQRQCACIGVASSTGNTCTAAAWKATSTYPGGSIVSFNGNQYTAAFWNQNAEPDTNNGPPGSGQPWQPPVACQGTCVPACAGKQCGSDGCGGSCGTCAAGQTCSASNQCVASCVPACAGKQCGSDGCGGSCGTCATGQTCSASNQCVASCVPACAGKQCGSDGCGGSCGTCAAGQTCGSDGMCQTTSVGCGRLSPWDPNKPWYDYSVGEEHVGSNNRRYACKNVAYCIYDPTSAVGGTYGWTDEGPC